MRRVECLSPRLEIVTFFDTLRWVTFKGKVYELASEIYLIYVLVVDFSSVVNNCYVINSL